LNHGSPAKRNAPGPSLVRRLRTGADINQPSISAKAVENDPLQKWLSTCVTQLMRTISSACLSSFLSGTAMHRMILRWFAIIGFACLVVTPVTAERANLLAPTYTPWTKFCLGDTCFIGKDGRSNPDCASVASAADRKPR